MERGDGWLADPKVARRYDVVPRTLCRWDAQPELRFPKPVFLNNRKYRRIQELDAWDRWRAAGGGKVTQKPPRAQPKKPEAVQGEKVA